jgi:DNA-binding response OmpR family regulator
MDATTKDGLSIAILEDDALYGCLLKNQLSPEYESIFHALTWEEFSTILDTEKKIDACIVDYFLSESMTGLDACKFVKQKWGIPTVMLTSNTAIDVVISCLEAGANQYINKPCDARELKARLNAAIRTGNPHQEGKIKKIIDARVIEITPIISFDGRKLQIINSNRNKSEKLTEKEANLLLILNDNKGSYIERDTVYKQMTGHQMPPSSRAMDVMIGRLRKKLIEVEADCMIISIRYKGYALI